MEGIRGSSSAPRPPWIELPVDVTVNILRRIGPMEILESAQKVCTTWWRVCGEPSFWRVIHMKATNEIELFGSDEPVCRRAVDRSRGELIDISIQQFGNDELLEYISDRSSNLNRLSLDRCYYVYADALKKALKNFPHLEELHIIVKPSIRAVDIESISVSCPLLKSFSFNSCVNSTMETDDSLALAIAKSMPQLCHLSLIQNGLSNEGLEAILDGCPNLVSLDLRKCSSVDLKGEIGRRCLEQIKELRCPLDSIADCDWFAQTLDYLSNVDEWADFPWDCYDPVSSDDEGSSYGYFQDYYTL